MEISNVQAVPAMPQQSPPPPVADARPTADAAAVNKDATPHVPLPMAPTQSGLVSSAAISKAEDGNVKSGATGVSPAERTLKPYGVTMLPNREGDTPEQR